MDISVIGLGKLGLCTAACFASAGHTVYGYDTRNFIRDELSMYRCPIDEPGLADLLVRARPNLKIVDSVAVAVGSSDVTLIIVPTPSFPNGRFTNEFVCNALMTLSTPLAAKDGFHVVAVVSTVMPGSSESEFIPLLERLTGKRCCTDFGFVYNPEFIALGSVIKDFLNPDMVLIGGGDRKSRMIMKSLYETTCNSSPHYALMTPINAEITKLSLNCYVTMKISFANGLASLCEKVPGADLDIITGAIGSDSRVGSKCLKGGLGFGGPCFPRDNQAFQAFADELGEDAVLSKAVVAINERIPKRIFNIINKSVRPPAKVAILGLSYKAGTSILEESQSIVLAKLLKDSGFDVALYDPKVVEQAREFFDASDINSNPYDCIAGSRAIALLTDAEDFRSLDWCKVQHLAKGQLLVDCWRLVPYDMRYTFDYRAVGLGL